MEYDLFEQSENKNYIIGNLVKYLIYSAELSLNEFGYVLLLLFNDVKANITMKLSDVINVKALCLFFHKHSNGLNKYLSYSVVMSFICV